MKAIEKERMKAEKEKAKVRREMVRAEKKIEQVAKRKEIIRRGPRVGKARVPAQHNSPDAASRNVAHDCQPALDGPTQPCPETYQ